MRKILYGRPAQKITRAEMSADEWSCITRDGNSAIHSPHVHCTRSLSPWLQRQLGSRCPFIGAVKVPARLSKQLINAPFGERKVKDKSGCFYIIQNKCPFGPGENKPPEKHACTCLRIAAEAAAAYLWFWPLIGILRSERCPKRRSLNVSHVLL